MSIFRLHGTSYFCTLEKHVFFSSIRRHTICYRDWSSDVCSSDLSGVLPAALTLIHDLLLVVILLELFRTIINFLKTHIITLEPFLYICIIASTRRILTTGAETAYSENLTVEVFHRYLLAVGVNVLVIVALVLAVFLARKGGQQSASLR